jgi:hypothetical protein
MVAFAAVTALQSSLLADCYKSPDPERGPIRHRSYMQAVRHHLGTSATPTKNIKKISNEYRTILFFITRQNFKKHDLKSGFYHVLSKLSPIYEWNMYLNTGEKSLWVCGFFQQTGLFGCAVAYTITSATSMRYASFYTCHEVYFYRRLITKKKNSINTCQSSFNFFLFLIVKISALANYVMNVKTVIIKIMKHDSWFFLLVTKENIEVTHL